LRRNFTIQPVNERRTDKSANKTYFFFRIHIYKQYVITRYLYYLFNSYLNLHLSRSVSLSFLLDVGRSVEDFFSHGASYTTMDQLIKPGASIKPKTTNEDVEGLLLKLYGIVAREISEINAYDDKNYLISVETER
jgi:hypothetical protein